MTEKGRKILNIILALLVSAGAWTFVVYNYDPMTNVKYGNVPITFTGLETLANRGYAVSESSHESVEVTLQQRRVDTGSIAADDISVTADVSNLDGGENTVVLHATGPDGTQVSDVSIKTVAVYIERASGKEMEIFVEYPEDTEENSEPIVTEMSAATANVITSDEKLAEIDRVGVVVDPEELGTSLKTLTYELAAYNKDGDQVLNVIIDPKTVTFKAAAGYLKEVPLSVPTKDSSQDAYVRTTTAPDTVVIKGSEDTLSSVSSITANEIDIGYYYENAEIPLEYELPEGIYLAKGYDELVLKLTVKEQKKSETENSEEKEEG